VTRSVCLQELRRAHPHVPLDEVAPADPSGSPEAELDRLELGGWVWTALAALPEPQRVTAILRYFGTWSSYDQIAEILGVPVGTIRSRLNHARAGLAGALLDTAAASGTAAQALTRAQTREFEAAFGEMNAGAGYELYAAGVADDARIEFASGQVFTKADMRAGLDGDVTAGVKLRVTSVLAAGDVTVVEGRFENPRDAPGHCPPATCQVHRRSGGVSRHVRLYFAARESAGAPEPPMA
jgi:hypothetical protein